jgi:hypothetical protein
MIRLTILTLLLSSNFACTDVEDSKEVQEAVQSDKAAEAQSEVAKEPAAKAVEKKEAQTVSVPDEIKVMNGTEEIQSKAIPTEIIAAKELDENQSTETNQISKPQVFIIKGGEVTPQTESKPVEVAEVEATDETIETVTVDKDQMRDFIVKASHLNVRSGPSMKYPVVRVVMKGVKFRSLSVEGIWVQMARDEYVSLHFLQDDAPEGEYVDARTVQK